MHPATGPDLETTIVADIGPPVKRGRQPFWLCPFHEDRNPSLTITPDRRHWKCFGCGRSGDAIDWVMARKGCTFKEAVAELGGVPNDLPDRSAEVPTPRRQEPVPGPDPDWQRSAEAACAECSKALSTDLARRARVWLINRGLRPETLSHWQIGYNHVSATLHGLWLDRGITIPWQHHGRITAINVRRPTGEPKYRLVQGSTRQGLFLGDAVVLGRPTLIVEGEFDALLSWQAAQDLVNVVTLGSATSHPDQTAIRQLITSPLILVAYDADEAGRRGAEFWQRLSARVHRLPIPSGKDVTEFHQRGGSIKRWIRGELQCLGSLD